jgi:2,4-dienoyl-CoA reductase-like NADH-dependent reductase (Old Yellow Enzyme family)/thioredoxin reductase
MSEFKHLFSPIQVKNRLIKNRVVMAAMNNNFADLQGHVTEQVIHYFAERAKGGTGLIVTSATAVDAAAKKRVGELCVYSDDFVPGLKRLSDAVHAAGARILLQIVHVGRELVSNTTMQTGQTPVGPSALPHPFTGEPCHELSVQEIGEIKDKFIQAALRAEEAGFDGVEVHGAHGYLLTQFTNPFTNRRDDGYGGGFEGRIRLPLEIVKGIREKAGNNFMVCYRLNVNELFDPGIPLQIDESLAFAKKLTDFVDLLHVSTGGTGTPKSTRQVIPLMDAPQGCYAPLSAAVKRVVDIPVLCVGRITTPEVAEAILARGDADMVAIARGLLSDPHWADKAMKGEIKDIRRCISCNQGCMEYLTLERKITCLQNPTVGEESRLVIKPAQHRKRLLVVGGGVAGMEAARVAALRGHSVEVWEKTDSLGGNAILASAAPWKREFKGVVDYLVYQFHKLDLDVKLNTEANLDHIIRAAPDAVILATGAIPKKLSAFDVAANNCFLAGEILAGKATRIVSPVCVIGGGLVGVETASFLRYYGHEVAVTEMLPQIGLDMGAINRAFWLDKISELGIRTHVGCTVTGVDRNGLQARITGEAHIRSLGTFATYVIAVGYQANDALATELAERRETLRFPVFSIGDCVSPRNALHAIHEGYKVAHAL